MKCDLIIELTEIDEQTTMARAICKVCRRMSRPFFRKDEVEAVIAQCPPCQGPKEFEKLEKV